jgi:hypothetical protein
MAPMSRSEQIVCLYKQGNGQRAIARAVGISQPAVRKHLLKLGLLSNGDNPRAGVQKNIVLRSQPAADNLKLGTGVDPSAEEGAMPLVGDNYQTPLRKTTTHASENLVSNVWPTGNNSVKVSPGGAPNSQEGTILLGKTRHQAGDNRLCIGIHPY